ncbi:hypothetical protein H8356DRAFT_1438491 [Neocallimastix lanati (nom. inval.)]|nr:hypothetical protein H8356DRAFT_1438491 [Neocallimastix sp. JGI-2020a]
MSTSKPTTPKNDITNPQTPTPTSGQFARQNSISYKTSIFSGSLVGDRKHGSDPEKEELIERFKSLQYNLKENAQLNSENQILSKYINNLMSSTSGLS